MSPSRSSHADTLTGGDEITVDYATFSTLHEWSMRCRCGTKHCRGVVTGNDWRLQELQARYGDRWSENAQRLISQRAMSPDVRGGAGLSEQVSGRRLRRAGGPIWPVEAPTVPVVGSSGRRDVRGGQALADSEMRIVEQALPGIGMRYEFDTGERGRLYVIARRDGRCEFGVMAEGDEPEVQVQLSRESVVTVAALLLGSRFSVDTRDDVWTSSDEVVVDVVEVEEGSPAIGRSKAELELDDPDAVVLAVMSDSTPDLVESETEHLCQVGDRIVVAARGARIGQVVASLRSGSSPSS